MATPDFVLSACCSLSTPALSHSPEDLGRQLVQTGAKLIKSSKCIALRHQLSTADSETIQM